jgi:opacity protein-like surface antigen
MKNILTTTAMLAAMTAGSAANAQDWYASVFGGFSTGAYTIDNYGGGELEVSVDSGYIIGGTVGRSIAPNLRAEAELAYSNYELDSYEYSGGGGGSLPDGFDLDITYLMGNLWYDVSGAGTSMTPYIGGGLGLAIVNLDFAGTAADTANGLAYQLGAGVQLPVGAGMADIGYRYKAVTGLTAEAGGATLSDDNSTASHNLQVGYIFSF